MQRQNHRVCTLGVALALALYAPAVLAQETIPELTGTVAFNVESASGRVERLAVTIGDGGTGQYKAILMGEPSLPTHAIYRPRDLRPFGGRNLLPIVAFGNGGCRNTSGEFRNFLSDVASQGFLVVAIGPAATAENARRKRLLPKTGGHQSSRFGAIPGVIRAGDGSQPLWCGSRRPPTRSGSARRRTAVVWSQSYRRTTRSRWGRSTELQRVCARAQTH